ncbi:Quinolinate phosphoribosyltransferase [decarboxylating] 2b, mitochondrial [Asimina triloba]
MPTLFLLPAIFRSVISMAATSTGNLKSSMNTMTVEPPSHPTYDLKAVIALALAEDAGDRGDVTCSATIPDDFEVEAHFLAKENGVIAGIALAEMIFNEVDPSLKTMADAAHPACILETRKTAPGLRLVDKWAVLIGGGKNHRMGLFDMVMIKDNHISVAGGIGNALKSVDQYLELKNLQLPVEIETRTLEEVRDVLDYASQRKTSLKRIMLDNMVVPLPNGDVEVSMLREAVELINGKYETEVAVDCAAPTSFLSKAFVLVVCLCFLASGNVTIETVKKIGQTGVTYISSGALTHSVKALDISLKIDTELALEVGRRTNRA